MTALPFDLPTLDVEAREIRHLVAWMHYAVTEHCLKWRRYAPEQRSRLLDGVRAECNSDSEVWNDGTAGLACGESHGNAALVADQIAQGLALLLLHQRDILRAERAAGNDTPESHAGIRLFGVEWNAAALIRERCDRRAEETERACELRAAGYVEPDWDALADAYVDGGNEAVNAEVRRLLGTDGPTTQTVEAA